MKKKILSIILVLSMLCAFMPVIANAADDMPIQMTTANITKSETDTTYNFDVAATEKYENCYVYAAIYAYDNTLLEVKRVPLNTTGNTSVSVSKSPYNALVKVFIWSDNMQPVIEAEEFTLTPTATMTPKPTANQRRSLRQHLHQHRQQHLYQHRSRLQMLLGRLMKQQVHLPLAAQAI